APSRGSPMSTWGLTRAAESAGSAARIRSARPSGIDAWCDMRASWPAPIMPMTGTGDGSSEGGGGAIRRSVAHPETATRRAIGPSGVRSSETTHHGDDTAEDLHVVGSELHRR